MAPVVSDRTLSKELPAVVRRKRPEAVAVQRHQTLAAGLVLLNKGKGSLLSAVASTLEPVTDHAPPLTTVAEAN